MRAAAALAALAGLGLAAAGTGDPARAGGGLRLDRVASFDKPTYVHGPRGAGDLMFVTEQEGRVKVLRGDRKLRGSFLNIAGKVSCCGERGLLSIAFPNYRRDRRFYVYFTDGQGDIRVVEYRRKRGERLRAGRGSARNVLEIPHRRFANHNGGQLQFGPDGKLWIGTGDGGGSNDPAGNAQDKGSLLGKLLRIDPLRRGARKPYRIPRDNPYRGKRGRDEIWSRGLRNPWRFSFDGKRIAIGDVGQDAIEEVDYERIRGARGANFGWDAFEGNSLVEPPAPSRHERPIFTYPTTGGNCAITGGYVARDRGVPALRGRYLYGDFCEGEVRSLRARTGGASGDGAVGVQRIPQLSSFGLDARKRLYAVSLSGGVWRFAQR
ncbi:MAG: PQQ-dependent sugar dehydrogenase [Solirubrobacterales bacterium]